MTHTKWGILALLISVWFGQTAWSQTVPSKTEGDKSLQFLYPAGQVYEYDSVFPLVVEFTNQTALPKTYKTTWPLRIPVPDTLRELTLQPGEKRRFSLAFPPNEIAQLYNLEVNGQQYSPELQSNQRNSITGLLSPRSEPFDYLRTLKLEVDPNNPVQASEGEDAKPKLVPLAALSILDPELVPEAWPLLSSLDVLIAYDLSSMALSQQQQKALLSWVCAGGRLVLVSDGLPEEYRGTPFEQELPLKPSKVSSDGALLQLEGTLSADAETLMSYNGRPLLIRRPLMKGQILLVTAPLKEQGPLTVAQAEELWRQVLPNQPDPNSAGYNPNTNSNYNYTSNTLQNIPELPRAGAGWVALFLLVYALIVGPINLGVLRKRDKMLWSFVTVPIIALLFAGAAYLMNLATRSSVPVLRELGVIQLTSGKSRGLAQSEAVFFSPSTRRYEVDCSVEGVCTPTDYRYNETTFGIYQTLPTGGLQSTIRMGTWDIFVFATRSLIDLPNPLRGSYANGVLTVDSPFSTASDEALLYFPDKGVSKPFTLKGGQQTESITWEKSSGYTKFVTLGRSSTEHPGRQELIQRVEQNEGPLFQKKPYLLFWTSDLLAPVEIAGSSVHKAEYLVIVELDS